MANTATLIDAYPISIKGLGPILAIRCELDSISEFTVLTPNGSIAYPDGLSYKTGGADDRFYVVGISKGTASSGVLAIKSGSVTLDEFDLSQAIALPIGDNLIFGGRKGEALKVQQTVATATKFTLFVVLGSKLEL